MAVPLLLRTDETVRLVCGEDPDVREVPGKVEPGQWYAADQCTYDKGATVAEVRALNGSEKGRLVLSEDAHGFVYSNLLMGLVSVSPLPEGVDLAAWRESIEFRMAAGLSNWILNLTSGTDDEDEASAATFRGAGEGDGEPGHDGDGDPV